jgi:hypothetical protein
MKRSHSFGLALLLILLPAVSNAAVTKYALSMFHFNMQYVAGGLEGLSPPSTSMPRWELNAMEVEDMIVEESFEPVLDIFLKHPDWTVTLEMQGYFIDVLAARHEDVLEKLRTLAQNGGAEVVSFHYSDQLFLAFPYEDWQRSVELTQQTFAAHDIPLSGTVFCQEGQAGMGMAEAMARYGYDVMVWPKNLWKFLHGDFSARPYYHFGEVNLVSGAQGVSDQSNQVFMEWTFFGDGELLATNDIDPYFPWLFHANPQALAEYEAELQSKADQGYTIGAVGDYVRELQNRGIAAAELPPLLDGTWQPQSTDGTHRWMGGRGLWGYQERDNFVRSVNSVARRELVAAATVARPDQANLDATARLNEAWRLQALAEVSDASGINPFRGEIEYGVAHSAEAMLQARGVIEEGLAKLALNSAIIDTRNHTVKAGSPPGNFPTITPPLTVSISGGQRRVVQEWVKIADNPAVSRLTLTYKPLSQQGEGSVSSRFPGSGTVINYSPALQDDRLTSLDRALFTFESGHFYLPLANGLIGLGNDLFLIKDTAYCHLAAEIQQNSPDVAFRDETAAWHETTTHVFYLVQGATAALAWADRINIQPTLYRSRSTTPSGPTAKIAMKLDFEVQGRSTLDITRRGTALSGTFRIGRGYDIIAANTQLSGTGQLLSFEGGVVMHSLRFTGPAVASGPCGSQKMNYSATLLAKSGNNYVSGGFVTYCGANNWSGRPIRVYRLAGWRSGE